MAILLPPEYLPSGFNYPAEYLRVVEADIVDFEPWQILTGQSLFDRQSGLSERYPDRRLVVIAARTDNDDVACWDLDGGGVTIVHDYASPGWERRSGFPTFKSWILAAFDEFLEFQ